MNKIIVEQEENKLEQVDVLIKRIELSKVVFHIYKKVNCGILNIPESCEIEIYLHDSAVLNLDLFVQMKDCRNHIHIYSEQETILNIHYACLFEGKNFLEILNDIKGSNTKANIIVHAVENNGTIKIKAEGSIKEKTVSNVYTENIKALTNNNKNVTILPNLLVNTNGVIANHNATIAPVNEAVLFYLESKGIKKERAIELIKIGFLKGILKLEEIKQEVSLINE